MCLPLTLWLNSQDCRVFAKGRRCLLQAPAVKDVSVQRGCLGRDHAFLEHGSKLYGAGCLGRTDLLSFGGRGER